MNPDLVARENQNKPYTVRYGAVNAVLLNKFVKKRRKSEKQDRNIAELEATVTKVNRSFRR